MKKLWKYLKILITIGVVIFFIYYFSNNREDFLLVLSTPLEYILLIGLFYSLVFFLNGVFIKIILGSFGKVISAFESFYVSVISSLGNYFLPMRGGAVIRSVYLKKKFSFSYSHFVSTLYGYYIIVFLVNSFFALIALLFITLKYGTVSLPLYIFFGGLFLFMLILSFVHFPTEKVKEGRVGLINKFLKILKEILNGWNIIVDNKGLLFSLVFITLLAFVLHIFLFYIEFMALGIETNFINVVLYNCLSGVSLLVSLTPGSLGIREGIFVITSDILGITSEQVMQLALLDRGVMVVVLVGLFVGFYFLNILLRKNANK
jgi:glycosyltransferase 2 family protein